MTGRVLAMHYWMCRPCKWNLLPLCPAQSPATKSRPATNVSAPMAQMGVGSTVSGVWLCNRWAATQTYHLPDLLHQLLSQEATGRFKCQGFTILYYFIKCTADGHVSIHILCCKSFRVSTLFLKGRSKIPFFPVCI